MIPIVCLCSFLSAISVLYRQLKRIASFTNHSISCFMYFVHISLFALRAYMHVMREFAKINFRSIIFTAIPIFPSKNIRNKNDVYITTCICFHCIFRNVYGRAMILSLTHHSIRTQRYWIRNVVFKYLPMPWVLCLWQRWQSKLNWSFHISCLLFIEPLNSNIESMWRSKRNKFNSLKIDLIFGTWNVLCQWNYITLTLMKLNH